MDDLLRDELTTRRVALGLTQTEAGDSCTPPIKQETISEIETGATDPHFATIERYCRDALGCRVVLVDL